MEYWAYSLELKKGGKMENNRMTADYVVTKLKNKTGNEAFFKHLINSCKKNNKFSEEMAKIRFVWVGKR